MASLNTYGTLGNRITVMHEKFHPRGTIDVKKEIEFVDLLHI